MKQKIFRLPETVINQIAAGEVVENPASIVKELIENSLDAGAETIAIEIVSGGQQLIRIEDDGYGMGPEDAALCLERHATSKIRSVEDLQGLNTMGFRGEALAAIASVSHLELKTSDGTATRIVAEGGKIVSVAPCARNRGTTIEVRSLFYNVPARKKFQKSASANTAQVARMVETLSLAHPHVAFSLHSNGGVAFEVKKRAMKERIEEVVGSFEHEIQRGEIGGFIAAPAKAGPTRTGQYLFINRRPIFSPLVAKAVKEGFGTRIGEHSYPPFVLFLEVSPESVDVNVHPQKREVRFREEGKIFRLVQEAVAAAFAPSVSFPESLSFTPPPAFSFAEELPWERKEEAPVELPLSFAERPLAVLGSFLLLQAEGLTLVDLAGAHARVLFETLKEERGASQALIWPLQLELKRGEEAIAEELQGIGIECRLLGSKTLVIDALPPFLEAAHFPLFLESWKEKKKLDQMAPHFCRRIKKSYSLEEANALWRRLQKCGDRLYDPLGRRIWTAVQAEDLEWMIRGSKN